MDGPSNGAARPDPTRAGRWRKRRGRRTLLRPSSQLVHRAGSGTWDEGIRRSLRHLGLRGSRRGGSRSTEPDGEPPRNSAKCC